MAFRHYFPLFFFAGIITFSTGCGGSDKIILSGSIQEGGQPYHTTTEGDAIGIIFHSQADSQAIGADVDSKKGTFSTKGPKGEGIPFGSYKITVKHLDYKTQKDQLKGKFSDLKKTPYSFNISKENKGKIIIDLKTEKVTGP